MEREAPDLRRRIALKIPEAAAALGCSESTLRRILHELDGCVFRVGNSTRISVEGLRRWSLRQAEREDEGGSREADAILAAMQGDEQGDEHGGEG